MNETTTISGGIAHRHGESATSVLVAAGCWVQRCYGRARQRRQLAELDPRLKRDIGVTPVDVMSECAKPFWR